MGDNLGLEIGRRIAEIDGAEPLLGRLLQVLEDALISRVIGNDELKIRVRLQDLVLLFQRQYSAIIGQRVNDHRGILSGFDDFIEIADRAVAHRQGQRSVVPDRAVGIEQVTAHQIGRGHVLVARHGDQRSFEPPRHMLDKTGLSTAGRPFEHERHAVLIGRLIMRRFVTDRAIIGLVGNHIVF